MQCLERRGIHNNEVLNTDAFPRVKYGIPLACENTAFEKSYLIYIPWVDNTGKSILQPLHQPSTNHSTAETPDTQNNILLPRTPPCDGGPLTLIEGGLTDVEMFLIDSKF